MMLARGSSTSWGGTAMQWQRAIHAAHATAMVALFLGGWAGRDVCAAGSAAERAVEEAKKFAGTTLVVEWQSGLQALDPLNFSGPLWESLTGVKIKVVEVPLAEAFSKIMLEYR